MRGQLLAAANGYFQLFKITVYLLGGSDKVSLFILVILQDGIRLGIRHFQFKFIYTPSNHNKSCLRTFFAVVFVVVIMAKRDVNECFFVAKSSTDM